MEAGRDKSNKNRIEFNDPQMLIYLSEAYYRTKKFSEALEIYFEMRKQFPAVRQIQVVMQGVYSMEQKSAGDAKIFWLRQMQFYTVYELNQRFNTQIYKYEYKNNQQLFEGFAQK